MQSIAPDLVSPLSVAGEGAERKMKIRGFREKWAWTPRRWIYITDDTGVGNPALSTPEKGEKFLKCCTQKLAEFIKDFSKVKSEEHLYEQS
jgi:creatinine amidohydrolase